MVGDTPTDTKCQRRRAGQICQSRDRFPPQRWVRHSTPDSSTWEKPFPRLTNRSSPMSVARGCVDGGCLPVPDNMPSAIDAEKSGRRMPSVPICRAPGMVDLTQVQRGAPGNLALKCLTLLSIVCQGSVGQFAWARPSIVRRPRALAACPRPNQTEKLGG